MKPLLTCLLSLSMLAPFAKLNAQDVHFSQYYSFTPSLNPALTANYDGSYRFALIYRNQWSSVLKDDAFVTPGIAVDLPLFEGQLRNSKLGVGLMVLNDIAGTASMSNLTAGFSLAYHRGLGLEGNHRISLGGQVAYVQKSIDPETLVFYDQFDEVSYSGNFNTSGENLMQSSFNYFDYNVGLYWKSNFNDKFRLQAGFGTYHLSTPLEAYIDESSDDAALYMRYVADLGLDIKLSKSGKWWFNPDGIYMVQGPAEQITFGGSFGYFFNSGFRDNSSFHFGARYRMGDAVIAMTQVEFRNLRLGFAYDVNVSNLQESTINKGGFEVSMVYIGETVKSFKDAKSLPCRRF